MRAVVFAYQAFGVEGLRSLLRRGWTVPLLLTHRDRPGEQIWWASVAELAKIHGIPALFDVDMKDPDILAQITAAQPDHLFSFYYRYMIPGRVLNLCPGRTWNLHGSLLPRYRGRSPLNWQLLYGERHSGVTLHEMLRQADAGGILGQVHAELSPDDDALSANRHLVALCPGMLDAALAQLESGQWTLRAQDPAQVSYFGGRKPEDGQVDWTWPAARVHDLIRAVSRPWPGAFSFIDGKKLMLWRSKILHADGQHGAPGTLIGPNLVACGSGSLLLVDAETDSERWPDLQPGSRLG